MKISLAQFLSISKEVVSTMEPLAPEGVLCNIRVRADSLAFDIREPKEMQDIASLAVFLKPQQVAGELSFVPEAVLTASICSSDMDTAVDSIVALRSMAKALRHRFDGVKVMP